MLQTQWSLRWLDMRQRECLYISCSPVQSRNICHNSALIASQYVQLWHCNLNASSICLIGGLVHWGEHANQTHLKALFFANCFVDLLGTQDKDTFCCPTVGAILYLFDDDRSSIYSGIQGNCTLLPANILLSLRSYPARGHQLEDL